MSQERCEAGDRLCHAVEALRTAMAIGFSTRRATPGAAPPPPFAYAACPACHGPVDVSRTARTAAVDVLAAMACALDDSAVADPRLALECVIEAMRAWEGDELQESLWPIEELARRVAVASSSRRGDAGL